MTIDLKNFWYIIAESRELTLNKVLSRQILDEWLVCYRDDTGTPRVLRDRCLHRAGRLSQGTIQQGNLICPYHGWKYNGEGKVISIPSHNQINPCRLKAKSYSTCEQDGYIYVRLGDNNPSFRPFAMEYYRKPGWVNIRLQNLFHNTLINCVENFIDIPHTAFVHKGIFRNYCNEEIKAQITRTQGQVHVSYANERRNLGSFNWFLNPKGNTISHTDSFFMPNVTCVIYRLNSIWQYVIISQSIPVSPTQTLVYTELSYHFGLWTRWAKWLVKRQGQRVINQDIQVLNQQMAVINKYGEHFFDTPADKIHTCVSEIYHSLVEGRDPRLLADEHLEVTFTV